MPRYISVTSDTRPSGTRENVTKAIEDPLGSEGLNGEDVYHDLASAYALYERLRTSVPPLPHVHQSLDTIDAAFRRYTPSNLCIAFNGGKDATVILHLTLASFANYVMSLPSSENENPKIAFGEESARSRFRLNCLYLTGKSDDNFPEVNAFVRETVASVSVLHGMNVEMGIRDGIEEFVKSRSSLCAFVMGTRRTDPYSEDMKDFEPSSVGWPCFMRVNPILDWRYAQVWTFLRTFQIRFCSLYHHGYTSLGSISSTSPNPALRRIVGNTVTYSPAWHLEDEELERAGRRK